MTIRHSETFYRKASAENAITFTRYVAPDETNDELNQNSDDAAYFMLLGKNQQIIGHSDPYHSLKAAKEGIRAVMAITMEINPLATPGRSPAPVWLYAAEFIALDQAAGEKMALHCITSCFFLQALKSLLLYCPRGQTDLTSEERPMLTPELLSPAGSLKNMRYAFAYGADAVYAGQPRYSLRVRNNEFNHQNLALGITQAHQLGKKFYVVVNIAPHNAKLKTFLRDLQPVIAMGADALIMSDPGLIMLVREAFPSMPIHLSVQANAVNWATVKFWQQAGLSRVILSRELSLEEIGEIRAQVPDMEIEVFVHGALCMAYSGRCLLSGYINKRDPNQGTCTNACRWEYKVHEAKEDEVGNIVHQHIPVTEIDTPLGQGAPTDHLFLLEESHRPGEYLPVFEDQHGTYIMNSRDLRAVQHTERLADIGVHSLKIEGRTKSFYYCARTAQVYRRAIDAAAAGKPFDPILLTTLEKLAHRGYTEGFLRRHTHHELQNYDYGYSVSDRQQFVGEFSGERRGDRAEIWVKNKFSCYDSVELMTPQGNISFTVESMTNGRDEAIQVAPGNGHTVYLPVPPEVNVQFALLLRNLDGTTTRYPHGRLGANIALF